MALIQEIVDRPYSAFEDRADAGYRLADYVFEQGAPVHVVVAVPSGGVAVADPLARQLGVELDIVLVRKLPLPMAPEAGFGAVTLDGEVELNERLAHGLPRSEVRRVQDEVIEGLRQREEVLMRGRSHPDLAGLDVLLVDDGLASGYTMMAAVRQVRRRGPRSVRVAVPDAPLGSIERVGALADEVYCLVGQRGGSFAVASFYRRWHDLTDREVIAILHRPADGAGG